MPAVSERSDSPAPRERARAALAIWLALFVIYNSNGDFLPYADAIPNHRVATSCLLDHDLFLAPAEIPELLHWRLASGGASTDVSLRDYDKAWDALVARGELQVIGSEVIVRPSPDPKSFVNIFGSGAGLAATPFFALARRLTGAGEWDAGREWQVAKIAASFYASGSAALVYLALTYLGWRHLAIFTALAYGLGTQAFSTTSQALLQHAPDQFFLALGIVFYLRGNSSAWAAGCGAALSAATWCRPTSALVALVLGLSLFRYGLRPFFAFAATSLPFALALLIHNELLFGSPWRFGQSLLTNVAVECTGSPVIFQTPLLWGAMAHFFSPSRGLFIYSPFLLYTANGIWLSWRNERLLALRPISLALATIWVVEFKHFDWWSGWSYGNRHLSDSTTLLVLFLPPALERIGKRSLAALGFAVLLAWSIAVQAVGAFAFDLAGWNYRQAEVETAKDGSSFVRLEDDYREDRLPPHGHHVGLNVDDPRYRGRLWSWRDWEIGYYFEGFASARALRQAWAARERAGRVRRLAESYQNLAKAWSQVGRPEESRRAAEKALELSRSAPQMGR